MRKVALSIIAIEEKIDELDFLFKWVVAQLWNGVNLPDRESV